MKNLFVHIVRCCFALVCVYAFALSVTYAADFNDAADGNWDNAATWGGAGVPGANDTVTIDSHTVSIAADASARNVTIAGGTLNGGSSVLTMSSGGGASTWSLTSGTFNPQTGTVKFSGGSTNTITSSTTFNNIIFDSGVSFNMGVNVLSGVVVTVNGSLTIDNSSTGGILMPDTGVFDVHGDVTVDALTIGGGGLYGKNPINLVGAGNQTITSLNATATTTGNFFPLTINKPSATSTFVGVFQPTRDWTYISGGVDATTNNATIDFRGNAANTQINFTPGPFAWGNIQVDGGGWGTTLLGNLTLAGNWTSTGAFTSGAYGVTFTGASTSTVSTGGTGASNDFQNFTVAKTGNGVVQLQGYGLDVDGTLAVTSGTLDLNGQNISTTNTCTNSGTLKLTGDETVSCTPTLNSGSYVEYTATSSTRAIKNWTYDNLTINGGGGTFTDATARTLGGNLTVANGTFTPTAALTVTGTTEVTGGTLNASSATLDLNGALSITGGTFTAPTTTMTVAGNVTHSGGTFTHSSSTVVLDGTNQSIIGGTTWYNLTKSVTTARTLTFDNTATQTISNTLTLTGTAGNLLSLRSDASGQQWGIDPQGVRTVAYLDIMDSHNQNTDIDIFGTGSTDSGNNIGWNNTSDLTPPTILNITSTYSDGTYGAGTVIPLDITFSEAVTSTGLVTVTLDTNGSCTFTVTASTTATCTYIVSGSDVSSLDLTVASTSGIINDASSNTMTNFVPTTNLGANKALVIDLTPPTITNITSTRADGTYGNGEVIPLIFTFSEPVTATSSVTVTLDTTGTCTFTVSASTTATCTYTVVTGETSLDLTVSSVSGVLFDTASNTMTNFVPATNLASNTALVIDDTLVVARIVVDEPAWYQDPIENQCNAQTQVCYYPDLGLSQTRGYAPFGVIFQGASSTPKANIIKWSWDFGAGTESDPHGRTIEGMNAAHVFETPGTYTVTLTVTNYLGATSTDTISVTILPPSGTIYYVDSAIGNDSCDGLSQTVVSSTTCPWQTATKAFSQMIRPSQWAPLSLWHYQPGDRILFKRGQTFEMMPTSTIGHGYGTQGYGFGAYGNSNDPKPILQYMGTSTADTIIVVGYGTGYISFSDLQINLLASTTPSGGQAVGFFASNNATNNMLFLRDDFYEPGNGAVGVSGATGSDETANIFLVDSTFQQPTTNNTAVTLIAAFGVYGYVLLGNTFDHSGNHISYNGPIDASVIVGNTFNRPAFGRTALRITHGDNIYIADNDFLGWIDPINCVTEAMGCTGPHGVPAHNGGGTRYNYSLVNISPNGAASVFDITNVLFERNILTNFETGMVVENVGESTFRNNLFVSPSPTIGGGFLKLSATGGVDLTRPLTNVNVIGNTFVSNGQRGAGDAFIDFSSWNNGTTSWGDNHSNVNIANNIFHAVSGSQIRAVSLSGTENNFLNTFTLDHNIVSIPSAPSGQMYKIGSYTYDLAGWQATTSKDSATIAVNPQFTQTILASIHVPDESAESNLNDANTYKLALHLTASSTLNTAQIFNADSYYDYDGFARYTTDSFADIGAFEFTLDITAPTVTETTPVGTPTTDTTPNLTFTTTEGGTITYGGSCTSNTTVASAGANTITLSTLTPGTYTNCTIRVTDASSNISSVLNLTDFTITEPDTTAPTITITGSNPTSVTQNTTYTDAGATATDAVDGTVSVTTTNPVDTATVGTYYVTYSAHDTANNYAYATRTVTVTAAVSSGGSSGGGGGGGNSKKKTTATTTSTTTVATTTPTTTPTHTPTIAELTALLHSLQQQLAALLAHGTTPTVPTTPTIKTLAQTLITAPDLELNAISPYVATLQKFLNAIGYTVATTGAGSPNHETTTFWYGTQHALARFQREHNLPGTGIFGPRTRGVVGGWAK